MLYWDEVMSGHERDIDALTPSGRGQLALACFERMLAENRDYFRDELDEPLHGLFDAALRCMRDGDGGASADLIAGLEDALDEDHAPGVWDALMGLLHLLAHWPAPSTEDALEVMSYAYQVVLAREILSRLVGETKEDEVRRLEAASGACVRAVETQVRLLLELTGPPPRSGS